MDLTKGCREQRPRIHGGSSGAQWHCTHHATAAGIEFHIASWSDLGTTAGAVWALDEMEECPHSEDCTSEPEALINNWLDKFIPVSDEEIAIAAQKTAALIESLEK